MTFIAIAVAVAFLGSLIVSIVRLSRQTGEALERAEHAERERESSERMANEMLKERTVEDTARDLDTGEF